MQRMHHPFLPLSPCRRKLTSSRSLVCSLLSQRSLLLGEGEKMTDACVQSHLAAFLCLPLVTVCTFINTFQYIGAGLLRLCTRRLPSFDQEAVCLSIFIPGKSREESCLMASPFLPPFLGLYPLGCMCLSVSSARIPLLCSPSLSILSFSLRNATQPPCSPTPALSVWICALFFCLCVRVFCSLSISLSALCALSLLRRVCHSCHI